MYRWLLADAIPFGCSMRLSIEHGGCNMVEQEYEAVTVFYAREGAQLSRTDRITIMDPRSEAEHHYIGSSSSAAAQRAYRLSSGWVGASPAVLLLQWACLRRCWRSCGGCSARWT